MTDSDTPVDPTEVPAAPAAADDAPDLVSDDELPADAEDGADPDETDGPSARSDELPPDAL